MQVHNRPLLSSLLGKCLQTTADRTSWKSSVWAKWKEGWKKREGKPSLKRSPGQFPSLYSFILTPFPAILHPGYSQSLHVSSCVMKGPLELAPRLPSSQKSGCFAASCPCSCFLVNAGSVWPWGSRSAGLSDRCCGWERVFPETASSRWVQGPIVSCRRGLSLSLWLEPEAPLTWWRGCLERCSPAAALARQGHPAAGRRNCAGVLLPAAVLHAGPQR